MARLLESDVLSNQNISSATAIGAHTCATVPRIVYVRVLAAQVAGGGDYIIYATLTKGGTEYRVIPTTTATAAASLYSIAFVSVGIPMDVDDVLTIYLDGLAGDTTTPDTQVDFYEADYLRPTTADRTLAVSATGEASANLVSILGSAISGTASWLAAAFSKFFNKETPTGTVNSLPDAVAGATGGVAVVGSAMTLTSAYDAAKTAASASALSTVGGLVDDLETRLTATRAGYLDNLANVRAGNVTVSAPVNADATLLTLVRGDDYDDAESRELEFSGTDWPVLTSADITMTIRRAGTVVLSKAGSVVTGTGTTKTVKVELTSAETSLFSVGTRIYDFDVQATIPQSPSGEHIVTLARGKVTVLEDYTR